MSDSTPDLLNDPFVDARFITKDIGVTDRGLRKQITRGDFPKADGNLHGRNVWRESTYRRYKEQVLAGKFSKVRRPGRAPRSGPALCDNQPIPVARTEVGQRRRMCRVAE
jgi:hypothetical protein